MSTAMTDLESQPRSCDSRHSPAPARSPGSHACAAALARMAQQPAPGRSGKDPMEQGRPCQLFLWDVDDPPATRTRRGAARVRTGTSVEPVDVDMDMDDAPATRTRAGGAGRRGAGTPVSFPDYAWQEAGPCVVCQKSATAADCPCGECGWPVHRQCAIPHRQLDVAHSTFGGWGECTEQVCIPVLCHTEHTHRAPTRKRPSVWTAPAE